MNRIIDQAAAHAKHDAATADAVKLALRHRTVLRVWMLLVLQYPLLYLITPIISRPATPAEHVFAAVIYVPMISTHIAVFITMLRLQIALRAVSFIA